MKKTSKPRRTKDASQEPSRIQTGRMWQLHQALAENAPVNCSQMGQKLEVDRRTIHRDLDFMRDRLNLPIDYDARRKTYLYTKPVKQFPTLTISPGEMLALTTAQHTLAQYGGAPFARNLETALGKISQLTGVKLSNAKATSTIKVVGAAQADLEHFDILDAAIKQRQPVEFVYRKLGEAEETKESRKVHPHHVACTKGR